MDEELSPGWAAALEAYRGHLAHERGLAAHSVAAYMGDATQLAGFCAGFAIEPDEVVATVLRRHLAELRRQGYARSSVQRKAAALRGFFAFLAERGAVPADPAQHLDVPARDRPLPKALRHDQVAALLAVPDGAKPAGQRDRALLELVYASGARISEAVGLDLPALDLIQGRARLHGKGDKQRVVPVGAVAVQALERWLDDGRPRVVEAAAGPCDEQAVFLGIRGGRLRPQQAWRIVRAGRRRGRPPGRDAARAAPLLRHAPAGGRSRSAHRAGAPGARCPPNDPNLHSGHARAPAGDVRPRPPQGVASRAPVAGRVGPRSWGRRAEGHVTATSQTAQRGAQARPPVDAAVQALWVRYKSTADLHARERLILQYSPLVKYVAGRVSVGLPASIEHGDLVSYGMFGLIDAIEKFDLEKGVKFETYAIARIKGAIIDELRSVDWIPRSVRGKAKRLEKALTALEARLNRTPTEEELAAELEISVDDLRQTLTQVSLTSLVALDEVTHGDEGGGQTLGDTLQDHTAPDPSAAYEDVELRAILAEAIERMSEREKTVVVLYYFEGMTLAQIGQVLGVTESRVCQLHTKAVLGLRTRITSRTR